MVFRSVLVTAMALATEAYADCPVAADLDRGIRMFHADDTVEVYRRLKPGLVEVRSAYPDGYDSWTLLGQGVYVLELADLVGGRIDPQSKSTFAFPMAATDMPLPEAGGTWVVETAARDSYDIWSETVAMSWGQAGSIDYGECTYAMIPGTFSYKSELYNHQEVIHYLPELGLGVLYSYVDEDMNSPDIFEVTNIVKLGQ